jgi:hypothetical protein
MKKLGAGGLLEFLLTREASVIYFLGKSQAGGVKTDLKSRRTPSRKKIEKVFQFEKIKSVV